MWAAKKDFEPASKLFEYCSPLSHKDAHRSGASACNSGAYSQSTRRSGRLDSAAGWTGPGAIGVTAPIGAGPVGLEGSWWPGRWAENAAGAGPRESSPTQPARACRASPAIRPRGAALEQADGSGGIWHASGPAPEERFGDDHRPRPRALS